MSMSAPLPWIWVAGHVTPAEQFSLDVRDEGLLFGRGLFETTRTLRGRPLLWGRHLARLLRSADVLDLSVRISDLPTVDDVTTFVKRLAVGDVSVRLNVSAGAPGIPGRVWMIARPLVESLEPIRLAVWPGRVCSRDPWAGHKTFNYGARISAHRWAVAADCDDAVLVDENDRVCETATANLFVKIGPDWLTPALTGAVLPGTVRERILQADTDQTLREAEIHLEQFDSVTEAVITNSSRGVLSVSQLNGRELSIGPTAGILRALVMSLG